MSTEKMNTQNPLIQLTMVLRLQQLKRNGLPSLTYSNLEDYVNGKLFAAHEPRMLNEAVAEILSFDAPELVRYLAKKAISDGAMASLEDFSDVIGG